MVAALVEGNSIRSTCRMTGASRNTVMKLLVDLGTACSVYQDQVMRDLPCQHVQADEIWTFCYAKAKNVPADKPGAFGYGDVWTWVAIDSDTKLVPSFRVGPRDLQEARLFMMDVAKRLRHRVQLTPDAFRPYLNAVENAFDGDVDYAQLVKLYGSDATGARKSGGAKYSPGVCIGSHADVITGSPDKGRISTSHVERANLTMRMSMRRFTRLTNAFSKKVENLAAAVSLHFAFYNLCRVHQSLNGQTPAMAAGVADHVWTLDELIGLLEAAERVPVKRGAYRKTRERRAREISN
ncbi:MAG TPA: IS1 family transposase [Gaiellaceae bacterium]